ncbi:MAG: Translaldolase [Candidatus Gottesmanbacteria bacterium GW2011_GWA2_47_9]|uniref:Translaldolase n=1 Tax=Candidatus Gottesmanbacteria bacterium GW2011_GWA2_47_9 TaxID=1618445 RepID=A0A0G1TV62_9BACT|nr:MAG: Translaldolase [Candidatus Gottesmanbacteria bacterium GW2011_GWA2_47_9]
MQFPSKLFIDGGDPEETKAADAMLKKARYHGLDGQTTNPSLIAKRAESREQKGKVTEKEAIEFYRKTVEEMSRAIPNGQISIQVIGDPAKLTVDEMLSQARERNTWIPNGVIKFPCTKTGLKAAEIFCQEGRVNITLAFSQEQAAAVYAATKAHNYDVFVSPFVGRLDDRGENGMDVVANMLEMYRELGDGHVQVLTASVRNIKHILYALWLKSDVITIPFKVFKEWADGGFALPPKDFIYDVPGLTDIPYHELTLDNEWTEYDLSHALTDTGLARFWEDWKGIVS